jgi:hypothetical protein
MSQKLRVYHPNGIPDSSICTAEPSTAETSIEELESNTAEPESSKAGLESSTEELSIDASKFPWTPFPADLWCIVLDFLDNQVIPLDDDLSKDDNEVRWDTAARRDFAAISLVSRRLHRIAEPYLYGRITWIPHINIESPNIGLLVRSPSQSNVPPCPLLRES